jgi:hypothetical protein
MPEHRRRAFHAERNDDQKVRAKQLGSREASWERLPSNVGNPNDNSDPGIVLGGLSHKLTPSRRDGT